MNLIQGTPEWLEWRKKGIGASEIAAIIGLCPYSTPKMVYDDKLGLRPAFVGNFATQRGTELEGKARARYELLNMEDMPPALAVHPKYEIVRVSLDGLRSDSKKILEIKCLGKEFHEMTVSGIVPPHYKPQVQYQLAATGADSCDFFSFGSDESHGLIEVVPDIEYQGMLIAKALDFWENHILKRIAPPLTIKDVKDVEDAEIKVLCERILTLKDKGAKKEIDKLKADVVHLGGHPKIRCGKVQVSTVNRDGKFSYHKLTVSETA